MPVTTFTAIQDVYISSAYPNQNFANRTQGDVLFVGTFTGATDIYRSLLQFDIFDPDRGIPPNSTIESASLLLFMYRNDNLGTAQVEAFRVANFFDQNTVTFNTRPPTGLISGIIIPQATPGVVNISLSSLVQGWYDGTIPNNGVELRGLENNNNNIVGFRSTRFSDNAFWPALQVTWSKGTVSDTVVDRLSGAPAMSSLIDMSGQDQATFLIRNTTNGTLRGSVLLQNSGIDPVNDPSTAFSIPAAEVHVINYTAAADFLRLRFTAAGIGIYTVQSKTRDE
ncbi:MAG: DNRLRE domain-containing protein [Syntrophomonadaceae bacterium]|nr:DNRLRE domain-containing protein [Syntrophomonadaceae bacterium]